MTTIVTSAPAKLNLALAVSPTVTDGKHLLQSVFTTINLADRLVFEYQLDAKKSFSVQMSFAPPLPKITIPQSKNIITLAKNGFEQRFSINLPGQLNVYVNKNIPTQAGLGGGSSDAATTLRVMQQLSGNNVDKDELLVLAAQLGADVGFFLHGGSALMGGHGDVMLQPLALPILDIVLVKPQLSLSTALVYQQFDLHPKPPDDLSEMVELLEKSTVARLSKDELTTRIAALFANNLTEAAQTLVPEIGEIIERLEKQPGIIRAMMTGSGSTVFALARDKGSAQAAAEVFQLQGHWTGVTTTKTSVIRL